MPHKESLDLVSRRELMQHMPLNMAKQLLLGIHGVLKPGSTSILNAPNRFSLERLYTYYGSEKLLQLGKWNA